MVKPACIAKFKIYSRSPVTWRFLYKYNLRDGHIAHRCPTRNWSLFRVLRIVPDLTLLQFTQIVIGEGVFKTINLDYIRFILMENYASTCSVSMLNM